MDLCSIIRPQAIALVDAFNLSDYIINSPLGCADGDVYNRLFERVNLANPPNPEKHPYFESTIKPVLLRNYQ